MISRVEKIRLGVFLLVSATVLVSTLVIMAGFSLTKSKEKFKVYFNESVSGLEIGAQVKYNGVRVGQVSEIAIAAKNVNKVMVTLELDVGIPVKTDSKAVLTGMGITGLKFVEISGGTDQAEQVPPGGTIQAGRSFMGIIGGKAEDITVKMELALNKINAVMSDQNISNIEDIIANVKNISVTVDKLASESTNKFSKIMDELAKASSDIGDGAAAAKSGMVQLDNLVKSSSPGVDEIVKNTAQATASFRKTANDLSKINEILSRLSSTVKDVQAKVAAIDAAGISDGVKSSVVEANATLSSVRRIVDTSRENITHSARSLRRTMRYLEEFSSTIRDQPSLLLSSKKQKDKAGPED